MSCPFCGCPIVVSAPEHHHHICAGCLFEWYDPPDENYDPHDDPDEFANTYPDDNADLCPMCGHVLRNVVDEKTDEVWLACSWCEWQA